VTALSATLEQVVTYEELVAVPEAPEL